MQEEEPEAVEPVGSRSMTAMRFNFLSPEPFSPFVVMAVNTKKVVISFFSVEKIQLENFHQPNITKNLPKRKK